MSERDLFVEALARPAATRAAYLDAACGADDALRRRLDRLLALAVEPDRPPDEFSPAAAATATPAQLLAQLAPHLGPTTRPGAVGRLGHYDVLEARGSGGFGVVLRAFDDKLQRVVAVKVLTPALAATSPPRQRFLREARAAAAVRDEHVVQVYAVEEEPVPYLVMEYVGGETLQQRLDRVGPLPPAEAARLGREVALGLAAAHEQGLIHRDVKPANVLLGGGPDPRAKLTDFGLARAADDASLTQSGVLAGTPMFMAPEQARGDRVVDPRADLFSLGSVLYTVLAGHPPFRAGTTFGVLKRVVEDAPRPLREAMPGVPAGLAAVVGRLMAKDPAGRYATARDAAAALAGCLSAPPPAARRRGRRVGAVAAAAAVVVAAGLVAAGLGRPDGTARPDADPAPPDAAALPPAPRDPWAEAVAALPPGEQAGAIIRQLKLENPGYDEARVKSHVKDGELEFLSLPCTPALKSIAPLRAARRLRTLHLPGEGEPGVRRLDLSPLRGLPIRYVSLAQCPVRDLAPLADLPELDDLGLWYAPVESADLRPLAGSRLTKLNVGGTRVRDLGFVRTLPHLRALWLSFTPADDLSLLAGTRLTELHLFNAPVRDLSPLRGLPLAVLDVRGTKVTDFGPLDGLPLTALRIADPAAHADRLRRIPTLKTVNDNPVAEVLPARP